MAKHPKSDRPSRSVRLDWSGTTADDISASPAISGGVDWDTTSVSDGDYTLTSVAFDPSGNMGRSTAVNITVHNAP
jgi:hypothetical protein